jgi:hypothetical protein
LALRELVIGVLIAGAAYFALVFSAGLVLGTIRVLSIVPRVGERIAEMLEMPIMLVVIVLAARWVVPRLSPPRTPSRRLAVGMIALVLLLAAELVLVIGLRGLTPREYLATRDPVAATVYYTALAVFAAMPLVIGRGRSPGTARPVRPGDP